MLTRAERDALIRDHLAFAERLVDQIRKELPGWITRDDLVAAGHEGLVAAATRFDASRGAQFSTFAYYRIRGAVFDHIRRVTGQDPVHRARVAAEAAVDDLVESTLGQRPPAVGETPADAATALAAVLQDAATALCLGEIAAATAPAAIPGDDPEAAVAGAETAAWVRDVVGRLPDRERNVVEGVYLRGLTIEQAGAAMGLSKAWASRLHARALSLLRDTITATGREF